MAVLGEVKHKVIQAALILEQFTVRQLVQATNLNPESVESVIQRLQRDGYFNAKGSANETSKRRGKPPVVYSLTEDIGKREELLDMVDAFVLKQEERHPYFAEGLRSSHFAAAKSLITSLERHEIEPTRDTFEQINNHLSRIADDRQLEDANSEIIKTHIDYQRGRVACVRKNYAEALLLFTGASTAFEANGLFEMAQECQAARGAAEVFSVLEDAQATTDSLTRQQALTELEAKLRARDLPARPIQDLCIALTRQALQRESLSQPRSIDTLLQTWRTAHISAFDEERRLAKLAHAVGTTLLPFVVHEWGCGSASREEKKTVCLREIRRERSDVDVIAWCSRRPGLTGTMSPDDALKRRKHALV